MSEPDPKHGERALQMICAVINGRGDYREKITRIETVVDAWVFHPEKLVPSAKMEDLKRAGGQIPESADAVPMEPNQGCSIPKRTLGTSEYKTVNVLAQALQSANPFDNGRLAPVPNVYVTIAMKLVMDGWRNESESGRG